MPSTKRTATATATAKRRRTDSFSNTLVGQDKYRDVLYSDHSDCDSDSDDGTAATHAGPDHFVDRCAQTARQLSKRIAKAKRQLKQWEQQRRSAWQSEHWQRQLRRALSTLPYVANAHIASKIASTKPISEQDSRDIWGQYHSVEHDMGVLVELTYHWTDAHAQATFAPPVHSEVHHFETQYRYFENNSFWLNTAHVATTFADTAANLRRTYAADKRTGKIEMLVCITNKSNIQYAAAVIVSNADQE